MKGVFFHRIWQQKCNFVCVTTNRMVKKLFLFKLVDTIFVIFRRKYINQEQTSDDLFEAVWYIILIVCNIQFGRPIYYLISEMKGQFNSTFHNHRIIFHDIPNSVVEQEIQFNWVNLFVWYFGLTLTHLLATPAFDWLTYFSFVCQFNGAI